MMTDDRTSRFDFELDDEARFAIYHAENPHIYETLLRFAHEAKAAGRKRIGINMIHERLRWYTHIEARNDTWKLNNNWRPYYSRLLTLNEPELAGLFEMRKSKADATLPMVGAGRKGH